MDLSKNNSETTDIDEFCLLLENMSTGCDSEENHNEVKLNKIPVEERIRLYLELLSSTVSYSMKNLAIKNFKAMLSQCLTKNIIPFETAVKSFRIVVDKMIDETNEDHQIKLFTLCLRFIMNINEGRENRWEALTELVMGCILTSNRKLIKLVFYIYLSFPGFFGSDRRSQILQYYQMFETCLRETTNEPKVALFSLFLMGKFLEAYKSDFCIEKFSNIIEPLLDTMERLISTDRAEHIVACFQYLLRKRSEIFETQIKPIFLRLIKILTNNNFEKMIFIKLYACIGEFFVCLKKCNLNHYATSIHVLIQRLAITQAKSYPDDPTQWFTENIKSVKCFSRIDPTDPTNVFKKSLCLLKSAYSKRICMGKIIELLNSSDWKLVATVLNALSVILEHTAIFEAFHNYKDLLKLIGKFISNRNKVVAFCAIRATKMLIFHCANYDFGDLLRKAILLVIDMSVYYPSIHVKMICLYFTSDITEQAPWVFNCYSTNGIIKVYQSLFAEVHNNQDTKLIIIVIESICSNIECVYSLMGTKAYSNSPYITSQLLKILRKIYFLPEYNASVHQIIECLNIIVNLEPIKNEKVASKIAKFIGRFNKLLNLSANNLKIQPCFFFLLESLSKYKIEQFFLLIPKIQCSFHQFLLKLRDNFIISNKDEYNGSHISAPYGCSCCFKEMCDGGLTFICNLVTKLMELYNKELCPYIESYLNALHEILITINIDQFYLTIMRNFCILLNTNLIYDDDKGPIDVWNYFVKPELYRAMRIESTCYTHELLHIFTDIVISLDFEHPLNKEDMKCIGEVLNNFIICDVKRYEDTSNGKKQVIEANSTNSQSDENTFLTSFDTILSCVSKIIPLCVNDIVDAIIPLFKNLIKTLKSTKWSSFYRFSLDAVDLILQFMPLVVASDDELLQLTFEVTFGIISICSDNETFKIAVITVNDLKEISPYLYEENMQRLGMCNINKLKQHSQSDSSLNVHDE